MTRSTTIHVESVVLYSPTDSGFEGQICVIPSNIYYPGYANALKDAWLLPFSAPIHVAGEAELPTGQIVVPNYRLFPPVEGAETLALDAYLASLQAGNLYTRGSVAAFREDEITFQHARVLATVVDRVNRKFVDKRRRGCLYAPQWEETSVGHLQKLVADKFGKDIAERIETEPFFTFRRTVRLTENEFDPRFVDPQLTQFGGGRSVRFSENSDQGLDGYDGHRESDEPIRD